MKYIIFFVMIIWTLFTGSAQIGYQVSLLDRTTGEPRVNESVSVKIDITDSAGTIIISDAQNATTNEFGILSLKVGTADSFVNMDWSKLPLWITATVEGVVIGKSQILNVPVAEYAKSTGSLTADILIGKRWRMIGMSVPAMVFKADGSGYLDYDDDSPSRFSYTIDGNSIMIDMTSNYEGAGGGLLRYNKSTGRLYGTVRDFTAPWK